ncbi:Golgi-associated RAB2 interactor protein 4 [Eptesicus fuscus]|uniref:Golgi-associated RAB2 interactor protein 4 n=1 Tax=Eptesicus fuscus TaxID=29078 RepID=UPI002403C232|nr:Golgi-associated RAB2 interactor protein 4 [Eptesicus fuscus]
MNRESPLPYYTAQNSSNMGMFNTTMGKLQRQLQKGEYDIFKHAPIFESDFIQITRRGEVVDVHNHVRILTMGIASTSPILPLPDVMLLARPATGWEEHAGRSRVTTGKSRQAAKTLELTRLLPLKFVRISIHDREKQQLRLKFATGRSCYLQLCSPRDAWDDLFAGWENLVHLLQTPVDSHNSTYTNPATDMACVPVFEDEDRRSQRAANLRGKEDQDQVSIRSLHVVSEVAGATSAAFSGGESIQYDSHRFTAMPDVATPNPKPMELDKVSVAGVAAGTTAVALSMAITTSAAPEQLSTVTAGAATKGPGGSSTSIAIAGAANMSPKSIKTAFTGTANKVPGSPSNTSLSPETSMVVARAKAEPTSKTVGETAIGCATELIATLPKEGSVSEQARRQQRVSPATAEAYKSRKDRRERRERNKALRSPHHLRASESHQKPGGDKILRKPSSWFLARQRNDKKEPHFSSPGGSRPVTMHKGISSAPITKDSRTSHKPGRSLSTSNSGSTTKRLSSISSFWRNVKANLTTKTVTSPHGKEVDSLAKTMERNSMESIIEIGESGQRLEMIVSPTSEIMEIMTFEPY